MKNLIRLSACVMLAIVTLSACKTKKVAVAPIQKTDSLNVNFSSTKNFAFFSLRDGAMVATSDSASAKWDFALRLTTFLVNSYASGPGNAGVILVNTPYASVTTAPETGYAYDTTSAKLAIKDGSWYNYNPATRSFAPKAGQTFVFRTADNRYAKMELLAVDYAPFVGPAPTTLIYRFRFTFAAAGDRNF